MTGVLTPTSADCKSSTPPLDRFAVDSGNPILPPGQRMGGTVLVFLVLAALTVVSTRVGTFFDDEIATVTMLDAARDWRAVVTVANSGDVHPPLSYVIDFALRQALGSWKAVQLCAGLANAAALAGFAWAAGGVLPRRTWWVLAGLLATMATAVMWGASLRWYAWFNPVFALTLAMQLWAPIRAGTSAVLLAISAVLLFHLGYLAVVAVPLLGCVWLWRYRPVLRNRDLVIAAAATALALALCLPQLHVFLTVHLAAQGPQRGNMGAAMLQSTITVLLGNAVFPLGVLPLAAAAVGGGAIVRLLARPGARAAAMPLVVLVGAGLVMLALTGLGYKPRNAVFLEIAALPVLAAALTALPRGARTGALIVIGLFQLQGVANVALHRDTAKRSFNTPYRAVVAAIERLGADCPRTVVTHNDHVLTYLLAPLPLMQSGALSPSQTIALRPGDCLLVEDGSAYDVAPKSAGRWQIAMEAIPRREEALVRFRPEPAMAVAGRLLGHPVGDHAATLRKYRVIAPTRLPGWDETAR